jgi:hypothetical protein
VHGCLGKELNAHGHYFRKGTQGVDERIPVFRWLCLNPECGITFGVLPQDLLPICRTPLPLLKEVTNRLERCESPGSIARATGLSYWVVRRLSPWLLTTGLALIDMARNAGFLDNRHDPLSLVSCLRLIGFWSPWTKFCHIFSRTRYPRRWLPDPCPEDSTQFAGPQGTGPSASLSVASSEA